MMNGKVIYFLEESVGSMFTANLQVVSDSVFCTGAGVLDPTSASKIRETKQNMVTKNNSCKNRNDVACQSIDIAWRVCPGDTSVQILQKFKALMSETGREGVGIIFASMLRDITNWESRQVQATCLPPSREVVAYCKI